MSDIITCQGIGQNVSLLNKDMIQFFFSRSDSISRDEISMNSDKYRTDSYRITKTLIKLKEAVGDNKEILKHLEDLEEAINDKEYEAKYYIYKKGYQDALKSLFCLMAG